MIANNTSIIVAPKSQNVSKPEIVEEFGERKVWTFLFDGLNASTLYNLTLTTS
jgi:hypothetical protein